jgi:hypothetical protein
MSMNGSLDFLNMIKNGAEKNSSPMAKTPVERLQKPGAVCATCDEQVQAGGRIAVIDTETNWRDEVMSGGVAIADQKSFRCLDRHYYVIEPECRVGGYFSGVMYKCKDRPFEAERDTVLNAVRKYLDGFGVAKIFAYNGKFDVGYLPELADYEWYDIMRLAAYRQYNSAIPASAECCKTGRLKRDYGVEPIMRMLSGNVRYCEVHNAVLDAVDELKIMELLGHEIEAYECARL